MKRTISLKAKDGLKITADEYLVDNPKQYIVLCHRSHFNRGEYAEIAPALNELGYSCLAIDQRSGMQVLGYTNETYQLAKAQGLATGYLEAKPDVEAAIDYAFQQNHDKPIILVGSSYSASLALLIASEDSSKLAAVAAFSPGEYLKGLSLADVVANIHTPTLVLSAKKEIAPTKQLLAQADKHFIHQYQPTSEGAHGARVLWQKTAHHQAYWTALKTFLKNQTP